MNKPKKEKKKEKMDDILSVYRTLGINLNEFPKVFDPWELSKQYDNLLYGSSDCVYTTSSGTSISPPNS